MNIFIIVLQFGNNCTIIQVKQMIIPYCKEYLSEICMYFCNMRISILNEF